MVKMLKECLLLLLTSSFYVFGSEDLYKDTSYPYKPGPLEVGTHVYNPLLMPFDTIPMHTIIYYPVERTEQFPVHYFIGGFGGIMPSFSYGDILSSVASHGYVVAGSWPLAGADGRNFSAEAHQENIKWLKAHVHEDLSIKLRWDLLSYNCHSAGCEQTYEMSKIDPDTAKANVMWEPVSGAVYAGVDFVSPNMIMGAKLATEGGCSIPGFDHLTHYEHWTCPRLLMEAQEFGHCDLLDPQSWNLCGAIEYCPIGIKEEYNTYRSFVQGIAVAWLNTYIQEQPKYLEYLLDENKVPVTLSMYETDVVCNSR